MTKPNDFILNTDYLSLAQTNKAELTAYFPAETFTPGYAHDRNQDFTVPSSPGAIDTFMISHNGGDFKLGGFLALSINTQVLSIIVYRLNANTIRVKLHEFTNKTGGYSMPAQTIKVKLVSFKPPNVF